MQIAPVIEEKDQDFEKILFTSELVTKEEPDIVEQPTTKMKETPDLEQQTNLSILVRTTEDASLKDASSLLTFDSHQSCTLSETQYSQEKQETIPTAQDKNDNEVSPKEESESSLPFSSTKRSKKKKKAALTQAYLNKEDAASTHLSEVKYTEMKSSSELVNQDKLNPPDFSDLTTKLKDTVHTSDLIESADTRSTSQVCSPTEIHSPDMKSIEIKVVIQKEVPVLLAEEHSETSEAGSKSRVTTTMTLQDVTCDDSDIITDVQVATKHCFLFIHDFLLLFSIISSMKLQLLVWISIKIQTSKLINGA